MVSCAAAEMANSIRGGRQELNFIDAQDQFNNPKCHSIRKHVALRVGCASRPCAGRRPDFNENPGQVHTNSSGYLMNINRMFLTSFHVLMHSAITPSR